MTAFAVLAAGCGNAAPGGVASVDSSSMPSVISTTGTEAVVDTGDLVDPETRLPVRYVGNPGSPEEVVQDYTYLPRNPENLALVDLAVPEGYVQDTDVPRDDRSSEGGCA